MNCPDCKGKGEVTLFVSVRPCKACNGTGRVSEVRRAEGRAQRPGQAVPRLDLAKPLGPYRSPAKIARSQDPPTLQTDTGKALNDLAYMAHRIRRNPGESDQDFRNRIQAMFKARVFSIQLPDVTLPSPTSFQCRSSFIPVGVVDPAPTPDKVEVVTRGAVILKKGIEAAHKRGLDRESRVERIRADILRDMAMHMPGLDTSPHSVVSIMAGTSARQIAMLEERLERLEANK